MKTYHFTDFLRHALLVAMFQDVVFSIPVSGMTANATDCPRIVSREEWKARKPRGHAYLQKSPTPYVVVHHGGIPKYCYNQEDCSAIVRSYQDLHLDDRGWFDIGYNFVIGEDGNAYEGRGWDTMGAHAPGYNGQSIGICVIGDFTGRMPNAAAIKTLNSLISCGMSLGKIRSDHNVIGHRQTRDTECPGETFYKYVMRMPRWTAHPTPIYTQTSTTSSAIPATQENLIEDSIER